MLVNLPFWNCSENEDKSRFLFNSKTEIKYRSIILSNNVAKAMRRRTSSESIGSSDGRSVPGVWGGEVTVAWKRTLLLQCSKTEFK